MLLIIIILLLLLNPYDRFYITHCCIWIYLELFLQLLYKAYINLPVPIVDAGCEGFKISLRSK